MNILCICTGNTCRSPLAEAYLKKLLPDHVVSSAGVRATDGMPASDHSIAVAQENGLDLEDHRSRQLDQGMLDQTDVIIVMQSHHVSGIEEHEPIVLNIADPYGGDYEEYEEMFNQLQESLNDLVTSWQ